MGLYTTYLLPHLLHLGMRQDTFTDYRRRLARGARGRVLEIGIGSGLNLPFYSSAVTSLVGVDPSAPLLSMATRSTHHGSLAVRLVRGRAESLPILSDSIDTVVTAWTMCSITDVTHATPEIRRVLKRSGQWLFVEHGRSEDERVRRWQERLTPVWRHVAGGCHLNRAIPSLVEEGGFRIERIDTAYMPGPRILTFMYEGVAIPR